MMAPDGTEVVSYHLLQACGWEPVNLRHNILRITRANSATLLENGNVEL